MVNGVRAAGRAPEPDSRIARLRKLGVALLACMVLCGAGLPPTVAARAGEPTGCGTRRLESFDVEMTRLLTKWDIPGAGLAVSRNGRFFLARGYGVVDRSTGAPVQPTTKFRLGSMSKTITAAAVLKLVEDGRLRLDDKAVALLGELGPRAEAIRDPRVRDISVRQLLQHTAGFDRAVSSDPVFMPRALEALARQGGPPPPSCRVVLRDVLEGRLDFAPGTKYAYSNVGYCILGRIVEQVAGISYEGFVRSRLLAPAGVTGLVLGHTMRRAPEETTYHDYPGAALVAAMPGVSQGKVPAPYGAFAVEDMDAYGGWVGAPIDYLTFMLAVDGQRAPALLSAASVRQMLARSHVSELDSARVFYGLGVNVAVSRQGGEHWWHSGTQPGFSALAVRTGDGHGWVVAFNMRPRDREGFARDYDRALWAAARQVMTWPEREAFETCAPRSASP